MTLDPTRDRSGARRALRRALAGEVPPPTVSLEEAQRQAERARDRAAELYMRKQEDEELRAWAYKLSDIAARISETASELEEQLRDDPPPARALRRIEEEAEQAKYPDELGAVLEETREWSERYWKNLPPTSLAETLDEMRSGLQASSKGASLRRGDVNNTDNNELAPKGPTGPSARGRGGAQKAPPSLGQGATGPSSEESLRAALDRALMEASREVRSWEASARHSASHIDARLREAIQESFTRLPKKGRLNLAREVAREPGHFDELLGSLPPEDRPNLIREVARAREIMPALLVHALDEPPRDERGEVVPWAASAPTARYATREFTAIALETAKEDPDVLPSWVSALFGLEKLSSSGGSLIPDASHIQQSLATWMHEWDELRDAGEPDALRLSRDLERALSDLPARLIEMDPGWFALYAYVAAKLASSISTNEGGAELSDVRTLPFDRLSQDALTAMFEQLSEGIETPNHLDILGIDAGVKVGIQVLEDPSLGDLSPEVREAAGGFLLAHLTVITRENLGLWDHIQRLECLDALRQGLEEGSVRIRGEDLAPLLVATASAEVREFVIHQILPHLEPDDDKVPSEAPPGSSSQTHPAPERAT